MRRPIHVSGLSGFWDVMSDWYSSFEAVLTDATAKAKEIYNQGYDAAYNTVKDAQMAMKEALLIQKEVDAELEMMKPGPERDELLRKREEAKGFFEEYVFPAWQKFSSFVGLDSDTDSAFDNMQLSGMGAVPIVAIGAVVAAVALSTVAYQYIDLMKEIKNDPNLSSGERADFFKFMSPGGLFSEVSEAAKQMKWPLMIGGIAVLGLVFYQKAGKKA